MATRSLQINIVGDPSSFSRAMRKVSRDADDGSKRLKFLSSSGDEVGSSMSNTTVRMGAFSGSIGTMLPQLAVAAPALLAVAGAGTAVAGSMAAAAGGATALGVGLGASLAPILVVGKQVTSRFGDISKAYDALKTSQREGTAAAKKNADQALAGLSKNERAMVGSLGRLSKLQTSVLGGASDRIIGSLSGAINRVAPALDKLAKPFDRLGDAIAGVITKASRSLSGSAWTGALKGFVDSATRLVRPFSRIFGSIANIVRDVATAALPLVSDAVKSVAGSFSRLDKAATASKIRGVVRTLVGHTREWWGLIKEVGKLLFNVLNVGAKDGKGLVRSLTDIVKKWNDWLGTADGQRKMRKFIQDSIKTVKELARIVAFFGGAAVKASLIAIDAFVKIRPALRLVTRGLEPIVKLLTGDFSGAWRTAKRNVSEAVNGMARAARGLLTKIVSWEGKFATAALNIGKAIVTGILGAFKGLASAIAKKVTGAVTGAAGSVKGFLDKANPFGDGLGKEVAGSIGGVLPSGGAFGGSLMGAQPALRPFAAIGSRFGLNVSSGRRPGSITSSGNVSFHSSGEAIDEAGSPSGMMAFFQYMKGHFGGRLAELIYTPGGAGIKGGKPYTYGGQVAADHFDHVHVALDTGRPGVGDGIGYDALMRLWARAGGPASQANTAAAVALAESGGNASIVNSIGATGLWQIHPAEPGSKDPLTNARQAVRKFHESGWQPWEAYTGPDGKGSDGPYRRFLRSGGSRSGRSGGVGAVLRLTSGVGVHVGGGRSQGAGNIGAHGMGTGTASGPAADYGTGGYAAGLSNVGFEKATATAHDSLPAMIRALQHEKKLKRRRIAKIRRYLKRARVQKKYRIQFTDELAQLISDLTEINALLKEYRADAKGGATTISGAEALTAGVADSAGVGDSSGAPEAEAGPTSTDFANAAIAEAGLTPGLDDDIAATRNLLDVATGDLNAARADGDPRRISEAIGVWTSVNESLKALVEQQTGGTETQTRLIDAVTALTAEVNTQNEFSRSVAGIASREAVRALADVISGQIVGTNLQGRRLTAGNGVVAITP